MFILSDFIEPAFTSAIRKRGQNLFAAHAVEIETGDELSVEATAQGTKLYSVAIAIEDHGVYIECTCPYYVEEEEPCKHIWGTLLTAEAEGMLSGDGETVEPVVLLQERIIKVGGSSRGQQATYQAGSRRSASPASTPVVPPAPRVPHWRQVLQRVDAAGTLPGAASYGAPSKWPAGRTLFYHFSIPDIPSASTLSVEIKGVDIRADGQPGIPKAVAVHSEQIPQIENATDRRILSALIGGRDMSSIYGYSYGYYRQVETAQSRFTLSFGLAQELLPEICGTGRAVAVRPDVFEQVQATWEERKLELWLAVRPAGNPGERKAGWLASLELRLDGSVIDQSDLFLFFSDRMACAAGAFMAVEPGTSAKWLDLIPFEPFVIASREEADQFLSSLLVIPGLPHLELSDDLQFTQTKGTTRFRLMVRQGERRQYGSTPQLRGELSFLYGSEQITSSDPRTKVYQPDERTLATRDREAEERARARLAELGLKRRSDNWTKQEWFDLPMKKLPVVARALLAEDWIVEAEGKLYRQSTSISMSVKSNVDWFDLEGGADFGGMMVTLPKLLAALRRGESTVLLDDGTFGVLPETWVERYGKLARAGANDGDQVRFSRAQVGLLDALLAEQPDVDLDDAFRHARQELMQFQGVLPVDPPENFHGTLREYQREALGWMLFLQRFGFGGCLADDMGLGKTPMALALLATRKQERDRTLAAAFRKDGKPRARSKITPLGPSLVVVPKTLVFNWIDEAAHFVPSLRVLNHTGMGRSKDGASFDQADLIVTTYGTLRRDAILFKDREFDYVILDEAQAIKNSSTEASKAARLLRARHRLALSGTPIENHLGELWSLFEFLNPGMLGGTNALGLMGTGGKGPDEETRKMLARALRPYILRRTKAQVAKDLPAKTEQTIWCELEPEQRKMYNELRMHYRGALLGRLDIQGMGKSKIQILEALLRLRQAACHPGLVDKRQLKKPSAKIETLMEKIHEVIDSGGKALIFSQFTSLLAIVKKALETEKIPYEYLDGKTRDRQGCVANFQSPEGPPLFLISLKAGGVGLNLTAAEYVFLLDPWWNPAVEAQAIDRTHRIGQSKPVFAYRIVATDTVEEKILELQKTKRDLADAIVGAENSLIRQMTREDLELLLS